MAAAIWGGNRSWNRDLKDLRPKTPNQSFSELGLGWKLKEGKARYGMFSGA
jgi:hypothetical protein